MNHHKTRNILTLESKARGDYFIRKVADFEVVWGLFDNGWATAKTAELTTIPFWPEENFAALCANLEWSGFSPRLITLHDFLTGWLPGMQADGRICQVFPTPDEHGLLIPPQQVLSLMTQELRQYE
ncbi:DUF2750 domain-containing protein [Pseudomonas purpurea]|uniref:DUF2750 domain-containing protein n=1 Tax=Pseudomonas purpurea TaxID=3136737 RepID=UPI0032631386